MATNILALNDIINYNIKAIAKVCSETGKDFPSLDSPFDPSELKAEGIRNHPLVVDHISLAVGAAFQLIQTIQFPAVTVANQSWQAALPAAMRLVESKNVPELLRPFGDKGVHVDELAKWTDLDPIKLGASLRYLATHHYFREVEPGVFANNLLSSMIDSGKDPKAPGFAESKYMNTDSMVALASFGSDDFLKSASYLPEAMSNPETAHSHEVNASGFQLAFNTQLNAFDYWDNTPWKRLRFGCAMADINKMHPPQSALEAFDWKTLPEKSLVVDVGSGMGHVTLPVAKAYPGLHFALEDRPEVVEEAKKNWKLSLPSKVPGKDVHFIPANFFQPQPELPKTPSILFMRMIMHDWGNEQAISILRNLRDVAGMETKLVIIEAVADYACPAVIGVDDQKHDNHHINGSANGTSPKNGLNGLNGEATQEKRRSNGTLGKRLGTLLRSRGTSASKQSKPIPPPLLKNLGYACALTHSLDMGVRALINSGERTIAQWHEIINGSGWKIETVRKLGGNRSWSSSIICVPAS